MNLNCLPRAVRFNFESMNQILPESLNLNQWLKFEQAVGGLATELKLIQFSLCFPLSSCKLRIKGFSN